MSAPTWTVAEVSGMPTLMRDGQPVAYLDDGKLHVSPMSDSHVFDLLTRVLAPDEATIEQLAEVACRGEGLDWDQVIPGAKPHFRDNVRAVLAALADTSAQTRHTAGDTTGGGEDG